MRSILENRLTQLKTQGISRSLVSPSGIDLSSFDYLGFAQDSVLHRRFCERLHEVPLGASGARLLRGNLSIYEETENQLASFVQRESALLFSSGYAANVGLLSALLQSEDDIVFSDALNHASIIDGIRLSKAEKIIFPHRNYGFLEEQLKANVHRNGLKVIVTESLFSMEGSLADLPLLVNLANQYHALLIVDEAHSTGLWGPSLVASLGLSEQVFATMHTAGKSLGAAGAWVAGSSMLREYLIHFARSFFFSTAPFPALCILMQEAVKYYKEVGEERASVVRRRAQQLRQWLKMPHITHNDTPIIPILVGDNSLALEKSCHLQNQGWDVRAIRPPTVPEGTARLRVTVKWANTEEQLKKFAEVFQQSLSS